MQGFEQCGRGKEFWTRCGLGDHDKLGRQANDVLHQLFAACRTKYVHADPFQVGFQGGACCARVSEDQCCAHRCLVPLTNLPQESCQARMLLDPGWDATRRSTQDLATSVPGRILAEGSSAARGTDGRSTDPH